MNNLILVYCPECIKKGHPKHLLFKYRKGTTGTIQAYCKSCKQEQTIQLNKKEPVEPIIN